MLFIAAPLHLWTWVSSMIDQIVAVYGTAACALTGQCCTILFMVLFGPACALLHSCRGLERYLIVTTHLGKTSELAECHYISTAVTSSPV